MITSSPISLDIFEKMCASLSVNPHVAAGSCLKPLCSICWTCRTSAVKSLLDNYMAVYHTLDEIINARGNIEAARKAPRVKALMTQFKVYLALKISLHLFSPVEEVERVLQTKDICTETVHPSINVLSAHYQGMWLEAYFH